MGYDYKCAVCGAAGTRTISPEKWDVLCVDCVRRGRRDSIDTALRIGGLTVDATTVRDIRAKFTPSAPQQWAVWVTHPTECPEGRWAKSFWNAVDGTASYAVRSDAEAKAALWLTWFSGQGLVAWTAEARPYPGPTAKAEVGQLATCHRCGQQRVWSGTLKIEPGTIFICGPCCSSGETTPIKTRMDAPKTDKPAMWMPTDDIRDVTPQQIERAVFDVLTKTESLRGAEGDPTRLPKAREATWKRADMAAKRAEAEAFAAEVWERLGKA